MASSNQDILIIPGVEVSTYNGDVLVLRVNEIPRAPLTIESAVDFARERAALIVVPHPYKAYGI